MRVESIPPYVHRKEGYTSFHIMDMLSKTVVSRIVVLYSNDSLPISIKTVFKSKTIMGQKKFHYRILMICLEVSQ